MLLVVDAVQFGAEAGTVHCLPWDQLPSFGSSSISVHGIGLKEAIDIGKALYPERIPPSIILVGIEGRCFNRMRDAMTPETAAAADKAVEYIRLKLLDADDHNEER
jgi:hydrogenase maturation protease